MDITQILEFVDETIYTKTNKHLNDLQRRIIVGILKGHKYADVSETYGYSTQHVKKVSHELLQILSDVFGEKVKKSNLESVLERQINQNISNLGNKNYQKIIGISYINNCHDSSNGNKNKETIPDKLQQQNNHENNLETINKLRKFGLNDEQIAEALKIPLNIINQINLDE